MSRGADAAVGMMDNAYFVGRGELLDFFNELLGLQLSKIEQTASGAVACQMTEYIYPGSIPMSRVNWEAKSDYEFVGNYKLLQAAFNKHNIKRYVDVNKLIRAKYQDNLEFCQWLKAFYDQSGAYREDYDAVAVRSRGKGGKQYNNFLNKTARKHGSKALPPGRRPGQSPMKKPTASRPAASATSRTGGLPRVAGAAASKPASRATNTQSAASTKALQEQVAANATLTKDNEELAQKALELETSIVELEKERDFYFKKLRDVEFMLQIRQDKGLDGANVSSLVGDIFKILYATAEDDIGVDEDGGIVDPNGPPPSEEPLLDDHLDDALDEHLGGDDEPVDDLLAEQEEY
uniref:EB1 C-terminal domain-containing protein n=1 Tax=Craspedostauros australis TaxID=1486917 RepID=A0A7R9WNU4_9STRA|mmetsp:Transcript_13141/g.36301  ORF Transcript_13141/g.36301 Transcript_13141/m.36301 type:complete len:349 (+) Transcript_13141:262-1308(+)|eukprot:CAMPEP_0198130568 /NCGR_PEP_ID=MMETSP1442-20131203/54259_1 /TAXON_ID= /ORGANISM="Craspedostauros australis, Strain CCMP3328" /LENGTH=348 /DNA_ID=CAMNT_0043791221 /DNA_START=240 /DNA_END=1286 /DNA_ORIENTATION=+